MNQVWKEAVKHWIGKLFVNCNIFTEFLLRIKFMNFQILTDWSVSWQGSFPLMKMGMGQNGRYQTHFFLILSLQPYNISRSWTVIYLIKVGECLGMWWRPDFETLMYPFLPPNVKQPKVGTLFKRPFLSMLWWGDVL